MVYSIKLLYRKLEIVNDIDFKYRRNLRWVVSKDIAKILKKVSLIVRILVGEDNLFTNKKMHKNIQNMYELCRVCRRDLGTLVV